MGAILEARNQTLPRYLSQVNRLAVADQVNATWRGSITYTTSVLGSGRTVGTTGLATPSPPVSVQVDFSNGVTSVRHWTASSRHGGPERAGSRETVSVTFTSADGAISRTITTAPLAGLPPERLQRPNSPRPRARRADHLFRYRRGTSGQCAQGRALRPGRTGLPSPNHEQPGPYERARGGRHRDSAEEIAAALNAQVALDAGLSAIGIRFSAVGGEVKIDGDVSFDFAVAENAQGTGFASGLPAGKRYRSPV